MATLFADDFRAEEARFAAAIPNSGARTPAAPATATRRERAAIVRASIGSGAARTPDARRC